MEVKIMSATENPIDVISLAAGTSYNKDNVSLARVKSCIKHEHTSILEHATISFRIDGISRACYDKETEVLTHEGWKYFKDVKMGEKILTLNPETGYAEFQPVEDIIQYRYDGDMHYYHSQSVNLVVTPNHNMWMKKYDVRVPDSFHLVPSEDIKVKRFYFDKRIKYNHIVSSDFILPQVSYYRKNKIGDTYLKVLPEKRFSRDNVMRFLAWYISEGSARYSEQDNTWRISISQLKQKNYPRIKSVLNSCGLSATPSYHKVNDQSTQIGFQCGSRQWGDFLDKCGHRADLKQLPFDNVFDEFDAHTAKIFIDEYFFGDGSVDSNGCGKLYTSSPVLADQLYTLCYMAGYTATKTVRDDRVGDYHTGPHGTPIKYNFPSYVIYVSLNGKRNYQPVMKTEQNFDTMDYHDNVYCVTVPNHIIFVRRSGKAVWCGNCSHQLVRHRLASFVQQSQRYCKYTNLSETDDWYVVPQAIAENKIRKEIFAKKMKSDAQTYEFLLEDGVNPEDARYALPEAMKTSITMTMNAREFFSFLNLRLSSHAQAEIRELAGKMLKIAAAHSEQWAQLMEVYNQNQHIIN